MQPRDFNNEEFYLFFFLRMLLCRNTILLYIHIPTLGICRIGYRGGP